MFRADAPLIINKKLTRARTSGKERSWKGVMIHWSAGNGDADKLINYLDSKTGGWYHYAVDENGTYMLGDPKYNRGAHAGSPWNDHYIGVCIAHPISDNRFAADAIQKRGLDSKLVPYNRNTKAWSLDPQVALKTMHLVKHLCLAYNIPFEFHTSKEADILKPDYSGIICHHHVTTNKWDCIPWLDELEKAYNIFNNGE